MQNMWKNSGTEHMTDAQREAFAREVLFSNVSTRTGTSAHVYDWLMTRRHWLPFLMSWLMARAQSPRHEQHASRSMWASRLASRHNLVISNDPIKNPDYDASHIPQGCWWRFKGSDPMNQTMLSPFPNHAHAYSRRKADRRR